MTIADKENPKNIKRPELLSILCILTFIGSGLQLFSNLFIGFNKKIILENVNEFNFDFEDFIPLLELDSSFFQLNSFLFAASIVGAILMWKLKKIGFHLYTSAQILILLVLSIYNPFNTTPVTEIALTSIFIFLYYRNIKFMQ